MKVRTFRLPPLSGLQFHCPKKGILSVVAPLVFVPVNSWRVGKEKDKDCVCYLWKEALVWTLFHINLYSERHNFKSECRTSRSFPMVSICFPVELQWTLLPRVRKSLWIVSTGLLSLITQRFYWTAFASNKHSHSHRGRAYLYSSVLVIKNTKITFFEYLSQMKTRMDFSQTPLMVLCVPRWKCLADIKKCIHDLGITLHIRIVVCLILMYVLKG